MAQSQQNIMDIQRELIVKDLNFRSISHGKYTGLLEVMKINNDDLEIFNFFFHDVKQIYKNLCFIHENNFMFFLNGGVFEIDLDTMNK